MTPDHDQSLYSLQLAQDMLFVALADWSATLSTDSAQKLEHILTTGDDSHIVEDLLHQEEPNTPQWTQARTALFHYRELQQQLYNQRKQRLAPVVVAKE